MSGPVEMVENLKIIVTVMVTLHQYTHFQLGNRLSIKVSFFSSGNHCGEFNATSETNISASTWTLSS